MRSLVSSLLVVLSLAGGTARGDEEPTSPPDPERVAAAVVSAFRAGDRATLDEIERFLIRPHEAARPAKGLESPPGSPIGQLP